MKHFFISNLIHPTNLLVPLIQSQKQIEKRMPRWLGFEREEGAAAMARMDLLDSGMTKKEEVRTRIELRRRGRKQETVAVTQCGHGGD